MNIVQKYAPYLHFHKYECHFPGKPDEFRINSRFRQSNYKYIFDRGWNKDTNGWENCNEHDSKYYGIDWEVILKAIETETVSLRNSPTWNGDVTRPRDKRNIWRDKDRGFFLELDENLKLQLHSGTEADKPVPIFYDIYNLDIGGDEYVALSYWFFYILNWNVIVTHEGDWEHITLYFRKEDYDSGDFPEWVYFASHDGGMLLYVSNSKGVLHWEQGTHLDLYVSSLGHPSSPKISKIYSYWYAVHWATWQGNILPIDINAQDWKLYDGAWGEVGELSTTTGPLGPFFKRGRDDLRLKKSVMVI